MVCAVALSIIPEFALLNASGFIVSFFGYMSACDILPDSFKADGNARSREHAQ